MNEYDLIRQMAARFPRSPRQRNGLFACDAELLEIGGQLWALTMDDFSPEEDLFTSEDPVALGANLATATLSDLLAAGAEPQFFMHAVSISKQADPAFVEGLCEGIRSVLERAGCALCGGDVGTAPTWRYCGFAMGHVENGRALTHVLSQEPQVLWVTGELGDANMAAFEGRPAPRFELRLEEARLMRRHATGCIDTSGAFLDALWLLHEQNPEMRFDVQLQNLPLARGVLQFAETSGLPRETPLLGGAGEYELLFATPLGLPPAANAALATAGATVIGTVRPHAKPGVYFWREGEVAGLMKTPPPCPRGARTVADHVREAMEAAQEIFRPLPRSTVWS